jgi:protein-L-isoaspartate(D-aspartate) O-methyltransferase
VSALRGAKNLAGIGMTSQRTRARLIERLREQGIKDETVLAAMFEVPRHLFVDEALASRAYDDVSLPINYNQTISQPYIVARMIEVLRAAPDALNRPLGRVLEIGTGCGYQAAVLAQVAREVYTMERIKQLYERARKQLSDLKLRNVSVRYGDGSAGLPELAPFDGIIMAAAAPTLSQVLREQLAVGGRMVMPVGTQEQWLYLIERDAGGFRETRLEPVKFVPLLIGKA